MTLDPDDADRPNLLATASLVLGLVAMALQFLMVCFYWCSPCVLWLPSAMAIGLGWLGLQQARATARGREQAVVGITLGTASFVISTCITCFIGGYIGLMLGMEALQGL